MFATVDMNGDLRIWTGVDATEVTSEIAAVVGNMEGQALSV